MSSLLLANITEDQREALEWALELAYDDQKNYLDSGNFQFDYDDEWPEVCKQKAAYCRAIADMQLSVGPSEQWTALAEEFEATLSQADEPEGAR